MSIIDERQAFLDHLSTLVTSATVVGPNGPISTQVPRIEVQFGDAEGTAFADRSVSQMQHSGVLTVIDRLAVNMSVPNALASDITSHFALGTRFSKSTIVKAPEPKTTVRNSTEFRVPIVITLLSLI